MVHSVIPTFGYLLCRRIITDTGVVTDSDVEDTHQIYEVVNAGPGWYEYGVFIDNPFKTGDQIYTQKHADADNPKPLDQAGYVLLQASRVMAVIGSSA
jgi:co-chaperonin GroES (HSP10)